jgi:hypothetical protein
MHPPEGSLHSLRSKHERQQLPVDSCRSMVKRYGMAMEYFLVNFRLRSMGCRRFVTACAADSVQGAPDDAVDARYMSNRIKFLAESLHV